MHTDNENTYIIIIYFSLLLTMTSIIICQCYHGYANSNFDYHIKKQSVVTVMDSGAVDLGAILAWRKMSN